MKDLNASTLDHLVEYVICLICAEGSKNIHVLHLIPHINGKTQFPTLNQKQTDRLWRCGIRYDKSAGWFTQEKA